MDQWLEAGGERIYLGALTGSRAADLEPLGFIDRADVRRFLEEHLGDDVAPARLRSVLAEEGAGCSLHGMTDHQVVHEVAQRIADGRLYLLRMPRRVRDGSGGGGSGPKRDVPPAPPPEPPPGPSPPGPPRVDPVPLTWYELVLLDELETPLAGVPVELVTPAGQRTVTTDGSGRARVDGASPGRATAWIAHPDDLAATLKNRALKPRRIAPLPDADDLVVCTPSRLGRDVTFPHEHTQRILVVSRTDVVSGSAGLGWGALQAVGDDEGLWRFVEGVLNTVQLCSTGVGAASRIAPRPLDPLEPPEPTPVPAVLPNPLWIPPDRYVVQPGDTLAAVSERYLGDAERWPEILRLNAAALDGRAPDALIPGETLRMPSGTAQPGIVPEAGNWPSLAAPPAAPWFDVAIDSLHEALFDADFDRVASLLGGPPAEPDPLPPPDWPPPAAEAVQFANHVLLLALSGHVDVPRDPGDVV